MRHAGAYPDAQADFISSDQCRKELGAACILGLCDRQRSRQRHCTWMKRRRHMRVVDFESMDRSPIGECRVGGTDALAAGEERRWAACAEADSDLGCDPAPRLQGAVNPASDRIEQTFLDI